MKASKRGGSGSSAFRPCFRQQLPSERLTVTGAQLIQQHVSNCYPSSSFNTPPLHLTTIPPRLSFFVADKENKRRHVHRECGSVRLFLCRSLFFSPSHQWANECGHEDKTWKYFYFVFLFSGCRWQRGEMEIGKRWLQWKSRTLGGEGWGGVCLCVCVWDGWGWVWGSLQDGETCLGMGMTASEGKTWLFVVVLWCSVYVSFVYVCVGVKMPSTEAKALSRVKCSEIETRERL